MKKAKNNSRPTSKKCLTLSFFALPSFLYLFFTLLPAVCPHSASSDAWAAIDSSKQKHSIESFLASDLATFRREKLTDFKSLISKWERVYGVSAIPGLKNISKDTKAKDSDRYVAILATTKIQGAKSAGEAVALLDDKNWMVRSAALKSIEILGYSPAGPKVLEKLAKDPALVIRLQAIETIIRLRPVGYEGALVSATTSGQNYRPANYKAGRADWVPQRALEALRELAPEMKREKKSHEVAQSLLTLLNGAKDGRIRAHALHTIETLEEKSLGKGLPFKERAVAWNRALK